MAYRLLADLTLIGHGLFIVFVLLGGLAVLRWPKLAWLHLPCATWGALIEFRGWVCPLTPLENYFRRLGNEAGYSGGFIEHYVLPVIYPPGLTRDVQIVLGVVVVALNVAVYTLLIWRRVRASRPDGYA